MPETETEEVNAPKSTSHLQNMEIEQNEDPEGRQASGQLRSTLGSDLQN